MDHKWLEDFVALARERSFSRAAELRHVTQPQLSRRIRALELWVGTDLVNRAVVPLTLTAAGEELLPVAHRTVASLADTRARIQGALGRTEWITLATGRTLSRTAVPAWFARLRRHVGGFRLRLVTGSVHDMASALEQGTADFLLAYSHPRLPLVLDDRLFESCAFGTDELIAVCAARTDGTPLFPLPGAMRAPVPLLAYAPSLALAQVLQDALVRHGESLHLSARLESDFAESLHEQALHGAGVAWLPRTLVAADLAAGRLVVAGDDGLPVRIEVRLHRPRAARNELAQRIWAAGAND